MALNETWKEIDNLLTRATERQYPEAQELYDILSNDFVRVSARKFLQIDV